MMLRKTGITLGVLVVLAMVVSGCAPLSRVLGNSDGEPRAMMNLEGTQWTLVRLNGELVDANGEATLDFAEGQVSGVAFCNRFFGPYEHDGSSLAFGMLGSTMMACLPGVGPEADYLGALAEAASAESDDEMLILTDAEGNELLAFVPAEQASLEGTTWQLTGYNTGSAISSLVLDTEITAVLDGEQITGSAGCNRYFGGYTLDGERIEVGPVANTEMFCVDPEGLMEQEQAYLKALSDIDSYAINRESLTLFDAEGTRLLTFVAQSQ
jgi:heat shock protein HslJ